MAAAAAAILNFAKSGILDVTKRGPHNTKIGHLGARGHSMSSAMSAFDRLHMIFY